jgi:hypothetical protein
MAKNTYTASVTFENAAGTPETHKATIVAGGWQTAASRAVQGAKRALPGKRATSVVVVLEIERDA